MSVGNEYYIQKDFANGKLKIISDVEQRQQPLLMSSHKENASGPSIHLLQDNSEIN